jgi:hypothetical protein
VTASTRRWCRVKIGSALADVGERHDGLDLNVTRDESSPRAAS